MPDVAKYRALVEDQQRRLTFLVQRSGVGPVRRMYQDMLDDVTAKLRAAPLGTFSHVQAQGMLGQLRIGMARLIRSSAGAMGDAAYQIGMVSAREMLQTTMLMERELGEAVVSLPILEIGRLRGIVEGQASSVLRLHESSMARYGAHTVQAFERQLAGGLASGETTYQMITRIDRAGDVGWNGAERIVRTELSYAYNATARATNEEQASEYDGEIWNQWTEHVEGGVPLDDRVGDDSLALHGQVAPPGGMFTQPPTSPRGEEVSESLVGQTWMHPPNRPNDRSVLVPWRQQWGVPGWLWRDGARLRVTRATFERLSRQAMAA